MNRDELEFTTALENNAPRYGLRLAAETRERLRQYYAHVSAGNARLHLVAPCSPAEFATRHVLQSLVALRFITQGAHVVDVGSGAGLPIIPCLIARPDLRPTLIEASAKKAIFLRNTLRRLNLQDIARVVAAKFVETPAPAKADYVTCRALERFTEMLQMLVDWSPSSSMLLLFGGPSLRAKIESLGLSYHAQLMPESTQRFLFVVSRVPA